MFDGSQGSCILCWMIPICPSSLSRALSNGTKGESRMLIAMSATNLKIHANMSRIAPVMTTIMSGTRP